MSNDNFDFKTMVQQKRQSDKLKEEKYKKDSADRLQKIVSKKATTIMIGALSAIEKKFGFLWGLDEQGNPSNQELTPEEEHLYDLYQELRSEILDLGNAQIRNIKDELALYSVEWKRYTLVLPVKPRNLEDDQQH